MVVSSFSTKIIYVLKRERDVVVKQHARRDGIAIVLKFFDGDGRVRLSRRPIRSSRFGCFRATDSNPKKELDCLDDAKIVRRFKLFRHVRSSRGVCYSREAGRDWTESVRFHLTRFTRVDILHHMCVLFFFFFFFEKSFFLSRVKTNYFKTTLLTRRKHGAFW